MLTWIERRWAGTMLGNIIAWVADNTCAWTGHYVCGWVGSKYRILRYFQSLWMWAEVMDIRNKEDIIVDSHDREWS